MHCVEKGNSYAPRRLNYKGHAFYKLCVDSTNGGRIVYALRRLNERGDA